MARSLRGTGLLGGGGAGLAGVAPLLRSPRFEVFPAAGVEEAVAEWLPPGTTVTVTASPAKGLDATLDLTELLAGRGYHVVPHVSARLVADDAHLADIVARLTACGVDDVFVPAGDADPPAGRFDSALSLLERLAEMGNPFARIGITGYPETHPRIDDDITVQAMWDKRRHAAYIVSNLCFDPATMRRWISRVRARGVTLPLYVGLAGPVERARLLRMAAKAGAAESARFLAGHTEWFLRLGTPGGYSPERLLSRLAPTLSSRPPASRACICSPSTRFSRPNSGAGRCSPGRMDERHRVTIRNEYPTQSDCTLTRTSTRTVVRTVHPHKPQSDALGSGRGSAAKSLKRCDKACYNQAEEPACAPSRLPPPDGADDPRHRRSPASVSLRRPANAASVGQASGGPASADAGLLLQGTADEDGNAGQPRPSAHGLVTIRR
jgi:methylenetetrahydrofolate reductase (NADPH)